MSGSTCSVSNKFENLKIEIEKAIERGADASRLFEDMERVLRKEQLYEDMERVLRKEESRNLETQVREMYEEYPYPPRQHGRHKYGVKALKDCLPSILNDVFFGGTRDFSQGFRILIAGGGTGDPTLSCIRAFENFLPSDKIEIVHLDLSSSSNEIARSRVRRFTSGTLKRVAFVRGSILDIPKWTQIEHGQDVDFPIHGNQIESEESRNRNVLGRLFSRKFDFVHSTGVLHHSLHRAGLNSILSCLNTFGGVHIWVYAKEGRRGIDQFQDMMRMLLSSETTWKQRLNLARTLLLTLPASNSLARNTRLYNIARQWAQNDDHPSDVRISDTFLHVQEAQYV